MEPNISRCPIDCGVGLEDFHQSPEKEPLAQRLRSKDDRYVEEDHDDKDEKMPGVWESLKETALLVGVGVMGHSWDTYSDIGFSYSLASGTYTPANYTENKYTVGARITVTNEATTQPRYATAMIIPVVFCFVFTINQWWKNENGLRWKLITLPFLVLQCYPPFVAVRLVMFLITRNKQWFKAKKLYDESMSSIEPFLESIPQSHVLSVILIQSIFPQKIDQNNKGVMHGVVDASDPFFLATFFSSILSASFGVSNLLKLGPCPLIPRNKFGCVFFMVFFSILCGLIAKGIMIALIVADIKESYQRFACLVLLFCLSYLLPMLFQFANLAKNQGMKRALSISKDYPALLLMPAFSIWAFGSSKKKSCFDCNGSMDISVSFTTTLINTLITVFGMASTSILLFANLKEEIIVENFFEYRLPSICVPMLASIILVSIVACIDKCSCCSCSCCCDYCLPMTEIIPNTFGADIEKETRVQGNSQNFAMGDLKMSDHEDKGKEVKDEPENAENIPIEDNNLMSSQNTNEQQEEV